MKTIAKKLEGLSLIDTISDTDLEYYLKSGQLKLVKYKKGEETWSGGRGPKPKWVKALMDAGENIEKYKV